jgi:hypothetical protein
MLLTTDVVSAPLILAGCYLLLTAYISLRLHLLLQVTQHISLRKLFTVSVLTSSILRMVAFISLASINFACGTDDDGIKRDAVMYMFLEKALLVLFDLPDFCFISAYLLLLIEWAETFLLSRQHWLDASYYRKLFIISYIVFNAIMYLCQMSLYSMLFVAAVNQDMLAVAIYYSLAVVNIVLPALWATAYLCLSFQVLHNLQCCMQRH